MTTTIDYFPFATGLGADSSQGRWVEMMSWMRSTGIVTPNLTLNPTTDDLAITAPGGMQVQAAIGQAFMEGTFFIQSGGYTFIPISPNNDMSGFDRIDLVTLQTDFTADVTSYFVIEGTPAMVPVAPTPTQVENVLWQLPLAQVYVANGTMGITTMNITDERVKSVQDGGGVSLTSAGGTSLVDNAIGPNLEILGLTAGTNIEFSVGGGAVTINGADFFLSTVQTGNGMAQTIAHGLTETPFSVLIVPTDTTNAGIIAGGYATSYTADATNVHVTATNNLKYVVQAWAN